MNAKKRSVQGIDRTICLATPGSIEFGKTNEESDERPPSLAPSLLNRWPRMAAERSPPYAIDRAKIIGPVHSRAARVARPGILRNRGRAVEKRNNDFAAIYK